MMKRFIRASSAKASAVPSELEPYYNIGSKGEAAAAGYDSDYIGTSDVVEFYQNEGYTFDGIILAKPEYMDALEDSGLGCLDVVADPDGNLLAAMIVSGRVMEVSASEVENALPADF